MDTADTWIQPVTPNKVESGSFHFMTRHPGSQPNPTTTTTEIAILDSWSIWMADVFQKVQPCMKMLSAAALAQEMKKTKRRWILL